MSGIAGIYNLDKKLVDKDLLTRMTDHIEHRGRDDTGLWTSGSIGFGHRQFYSTPESLRESQPWSSADGGYCLCMDGRLDNRDEMDALLKKEGVELRQDTDAELVLQAFRVWSGGCLDRLVGVYAFAVWDEARQRLFCARDIVGIRTLYYYYDGRRFQFASEIRALLQDPSIPTDLDDEYLADFLTALPYDRRPTPYRHIHRLEDAHCLTVTREGLRVQRYWDVPDKVLEYADERDYVEHFRDLFREAVRCRMRSPTPVGVMMSGGLDSCSVASMAAEISRDADRPASRDVKVFSNVFDELDCDERAYSRQVIDKYGLEVHLIPNDDLWSFKEVLGAGPLQDEPHQGFFYASSKVLMERARSAGCRVMMLGHGADHILRGSPLYLADMIRAVKMKKVWEDLSRWKRVSGHARMAILGRHVLLPFLPGCARDFLVALCTGLFKKRLRISTDDYSYPRWVNKSLARRFDVEARQRKNKAAEKRFSSFARRELYGLFTNYSIREDNLWLDQYVSLPSGVETRHPFLDRRIVEFTLSVPPDQLYKSGLTKALLRSSMDGILPDGIRERMGKTTFNPVLRKGIAEEWHGIEPLLNDSYGKASDYLDLRALENALIDFREGRAKEGLEFFDAISLVIWLANLESDHPGQRSVPADGQAVAAA